MVIELPQRAPRVRFKHPVRVVPLDGSPRIYRTLTANLSRKGMFVRMPEPLPKGTRVALSLEAGGQALPFAEAEIAWCRTSESQLPGRFTGFGVRFTSFLNPRAPELVEYLVKNLDRGRPLKMAPPKTARHRRLVGLAAGVLALVVVGGLGARALLDWAADDDEIAAPEPTAPVAVAPAAASASEPEPPTLEPAPLAADSEPPAEQAAAPVIAAAALAPSPSAEDTATSGVVAVAPAPAAEEPAPSLAATDSPSPRADALPASVAKSAFAEGAPAPVATKPQPESAARSATAEEAPAVEAAKLRLESAPTSAAANATPAPEMAVAKPPAERAPKSSSADEAPAPKLAVAPKATGAKPRPATKTQGRLALPSGAAQTLSWEERGDAVHVGLALAPGATVGRRFLLAGPPRLVMDLDGRAPKKSLTLEAKAPWLKQVRIGPHGASTRVVVDLASAPAAMTQGDDGVTLTFAR